MSEPVFHKTPYKNSRHPIFVLFAYRYEPDWLIEEAIQQAQWSDGIITWDTREDHRVWIPREVRTRTLREAALDHGAQWVFHLDPDERVQVGGEDIIRKVVDNGRFSSFIFPLKDLFAPNQYRVDGIWANKSVHRLWCLKDKPSKRGSRRLKSPWIFHTKHMTEENGLMRARVHSAHNTWDNKGRGFDYLADRDGMVLKPVPKAHPCPPVKPFDFRVPGF
jgi:hypothetical protein